MAQATISAGPLLLHEVKTIYVASPSDDFVLLVKSQLEKWDAVQVTLQPEEADAILSCQTSHRMMPAKFAFWVMDAEATLVDRHSQKIIWRVTRSTSFDITRLPDNIVEQLKNDWRKSASQ